MRKSVELTVCLCDECGIPGWRQADFLLKKLRKQKHYCEKLKHSISKDPVKKAEKVQAIKNAHTNYLEQSVKLIDRVTETTEIALSNSASDIMVVVQIIEIERFVAYAKKQVNLVDRRVLNDEVIPHEDKIFSFFEPQTEWICKGKAGTPQELGLRVGIVENHHGFILTHLVMEKTVDSTVAEELISDAKKRFPNSTHAVRTRVTGRLKIRKNSKQFCLFRPFPKKDAYHKLTEKERNPKNSKRHKKTSGS